MFRVFLKRLRAARCFYCENSKSQKGVFFEQTHLNGPWQKKPKHTLSGLKTFAKHAFLGLQIFAIKNDIKHATYSKGS